MKGLDQDKMHAALTKGAGMYACRLGWSTQCHEQLKPGSGRSNNLADQTPCARLGHHLETSISASCL